MLNLRIVRLFSVLLIASVVSLATDQGPGIVPGTDTPVTRNTSRIYRLHLSNTSGADVTVTILDGSTNCGGSTCQIWPTVTIAANTAYIVDLGGIYAENGFSWSASDGTAIHGWVNYTECSRRDSCGSILR